MQTVLTKYWLAIHVAALLFASWIGLFLPPVSGYVHLLWFSLMAVEALVLLPTVRKGETLADTRLRVGRSLVQDPFFYLGLTVLAFVVAQWLNSGCSLVYLSDADVWRHSLPPVPWAPFSVEPRAALTSVSVFAACFFGGLILRNSVGRMGKRLLLQSASALSGGVACYMTWQAASGIAPYADTALHPGACSAGSLFGFWLLVGMGAYVDAVSREQRGARVLFIFGFLGNLLGMLFFAGLLALVLYSAAALLLVFYWLFYLNGIASKAVQLKLFLTTVGVIAGLVFILIWVFPDNPVAAKARVVGELASRWEALSEAKEVRTTAVWKIWKEHPWIGVGANGFFHYVGTVVEGKEWALLRKDQAYVFNDTLQFLCEMGVLGVSILGAGVVALLVPLCYRARLAWQQGGEDGADAGRGFLLRISPLIVTGVLATALCAVESWVSSPFRSAGLLTSWVFVIAMLPSFFQTKSRMAL